MGFVTVLVTFVSPAATISSINHEFYNPDPKKSTVVTTGFLYLSPFLS